MSDFYKIQGYYTLQDIKYDLLKIISPYDGYMVTRNDTNHVRSLFESFLNDLKRSYKIFDYSIYINVKEGVITYDVNIKPHRDRSTKRLKIHVGRYVHFRDRVEETV